MEGREGLELRGGSQVPDLGRPRRVQRGRRSTWTSATCRRPSPPARARRASSSTSQGAQPGHRAGVRGGAHSNFDFAISASYTDSELRSTLTSTDPTGRSSSQASRRATAADRAEVQWPPRRPTSGRSGRGRGPISPAGTSTWLAVHAGRATRLSGREPVVVRANTIGGPLTASHVHLRSRAAGLRHREHAPRRAPGHGTCRAFINNVTDERALLSLDRERGTRARSVSDEPAAHVRHRVPGDVLTAENRPF